MAKRWEDLGQGPKTFELKGENRYTKLSGSLWSVVLWEKNPVAEHKQTGILMCSGNCMQMHICGQKGHTGIQGWARLILCFLTGANGGAAEEAEREVLNVACNQEIPERWAIPHFSPFLLCYVTRRGRNGIWSVWGGRTCRNLWWALHSRS